MDDYYIKADTREQDKQQLAVLKQLEALEGVRVWIIQDEAGRPISRARIFIDKAVTCKSAEEITDQLKKR